MNTSAPMPLIPCPACGHQLSTQAISCPQCGHPIAAAAESAAVVKLATAGRVEGLGDETLVRVFLQTGSGIGSSQRKWRIAPAPPERPVT